MASPGQDARRPIIMFQPLVSSIHPEFWARLGDLKLDTLGLSEDPIPVTGFMGASTHAGIPAPLTLDARSLENDPAAVRPPAGLTPVPGTLFLVNSLARFKAFDRGAAVRAAVDATVSAMTSSATTPDPAAVGARFVLLVHADLKAYRFSHWLAVPALVPPPGVEPWRGLAVECKGGSADDASSPAFSYSLEAVLGKGGAAAVAAAADAWRGVGGGQEEEDTAGPRPPHAPAWLVSVPPDAAARAAPLAAWSDLAASSSQQPWLAFDDPSGDATAPGWPLRNLLAAVSAGGLLASPRPTTLTVLAVRPQARGRVCTRGSRVLRLEVPPASPHPQPHHHVAGWEANAKGRPGPRTASLAGALDPATLAADALALNLRLMRWRAAPALDLASISSARFLLLGAGTLGCGAARALLGWGATRVTLVDCGRVAFSNPPRQPLFEHGDCLEGGAPKAAAAAAALHRIFPGSHAVGVDLAIPMPGHLPPRGGDSDGGGAPSSLVDAAWGEAAAGVRRLQALVAEADVVMLLTDTRESRWLPSVLVAADGWGRRSGGSGGGGSAARPKLAVTAALGFDTFVVMRHGVHDAPDEKTSPPPRHGVHDALDEKTSPPPRLGCYFCSDVVAPGDSTVDRALDQQCTVARPGLAPIASALAVEVAAAVLTHPAGPSAPPPDADPTPPDALPLGPAPHMLRGRLGGGFSQVSMTGPASSVCTACSPAVMRAYEEGGVDWVLTALADPRGEALEGVSGLTALHATMDARGGGGEEGGGGVVSLEEEEEEEAVEVGSGDEWTEL